MKTRKSTRVRSHRRQTQVGIEREMLLDEFTIHLNTAFSAPEFAREELVKIVQRAVRHLGQALADVIVAEKTRKAVGECLSAEDAEMAEVAAAQIILGERQEASRKVKDGDLLQEWFDHVITD